jgi:hypothetical protein
VKLRTVEELLSKNNDCEEEADWILKQEVKFPILPDPHRRFILPAKLANLREVSQFPVMLYAAFNERDMKRIEDILKSFCSDDCTLSSTATNAKRFTGRSYILEYFTSVANTYPDFTYRLLSSRLVVADDDSQALLVELAFCGTRSIDDDGKRTFIDEVLRIRDENLADQYLDTRGLTSEEVEKARFIGAQIVNGKEPAHQLHGKSLHRFIIRPDCKVTGMFVAVALSLLIGGHQQH